ncbi:MAG TPA: type II secretion system protein [Vicinamibacterales bacterium]|jgi:type II secretory pathway pseudopilin PulG
MAPNHSSRGFTLVETVVATGILITALAGVAQLFLLGAQLTREANASGQALVAAQDKLESLRGLALGYDAFGSNDTDPALAPSPPSSLSADSPPYVDWVDSSGARLPDSSRAAFVRRWRIDSLDETAPDAITIEVCVFRSSSNSMDARAAEACLSTVRTRQP